MKRYRVVKESEYSISATVYKTKKILVKVDIINEDNVNIKEIYHDFQSMIYAVYLYGNICDEWEDSRCVFDVKTEEKTIVARIECINIYRSEIADEFAFHLGRIFGLSKEEVIYEDYLLYVQK